jgi:hypothetical protein
MTRNVFTILSPLQCAATPTTLRMWCWSFARSLILLRGPQIFLRPFVQPRLLSDPDSRKGVKQSKYVEEPKHHANDDDGVQDRLDTTCHGDKTIHEPQEDADNDQRY